MIREQNIPVQSALSVEYKVSFANGKRKTRAKKRLPHKPKKTANKLPRITRLLALAHHLQELIDKGIVADYADIARLANLSRARLTQIMNLTFLATQIQEEVLFSSSRARFPEYLKESTFRVVQRTPIWEEQAKTWEKLKRSCS